MCVPSYSYPSSLHASCREATTDDERRGGGIVIDDARVENRAAKGTSSPTLPACVVVAVVVQEDEHQGWDGKDQPYSLSERDQGGRTTTTMRMKNAYDKTNACSKWFAVVLHASSEDVF